VWSLQRGSWTFHLAAQGSPKEDPKRQQVKTASPLCPGNWVSTSPAVFYQSRQSRNPVRFQGAAIDSPVNEKRKQTIVVLLSSLSQSELLSQLSTCLAFM
jgi:hypothetical protein